MTTLFHAELSERDFSSHVIHVGDLLDWTKSKHLHLRTTPPIEGYEFVQVEALLCAIERHAGDVTPDQALNIVLNHPVLKNDPVVTRYPDDVDPTLCRWLLGAEAHRKWRELLTGAIAANELALLDFGSKLPIAEPAPMVTNQTEAVDPASDGPASKNKSQTTRIFEAKVIELMGKFWNDRSPGTEPTKGELCRLVYQEILRTGTRGARKTTQSMVNDAAKPWKFPLVLPTFVRDSQFNEKRHPFKGDR